MSGVSHDVTGMYGMSMTSEKNITSQWWQVGVSIKLKPSQTKPVSCYEKHSFQTSGICVNKVIVCFAAGEEN